MNFSNQKRNSAKFSEKKEKLNLNDKKLKLSKEKI